jgi:uncharacterized membrane protein YccC
VSREQLPNAITVARVLLVLPTAWLLWNAQYPAALVLMTIAGASDAGARRAGSAKRLIRSLTSCSWR